MKLGLVPVAVGTACVGAAACGGVVAAHEGTPPPATSQSVTGGASAAAQPSPTHQVQVPAHGSVSTDERALLARDGYVYSAGKTAGAATGSFDWTGIPNGGRVNPGNGTVEHAPPLGDSTQMVGASATGYETVIYPSFSQPGAKAVHFDGRTFTVMDISKQEAAGPSPAAQQPAPSQQQGRP